MRQAYLEKADSQKMKQKARERMQPKMGKLDIDYQARPGGWGGGCVPARHLRARPPVCLLQLGALPSCATWTERNAVA